MYTYVDANPDPNLTCCICRTPFTDPVTAKTCSHTFCQLCILQALSVSAHCPIDRSPLSPELLGQADPIVRHLVDELIVQCPNWEDGCRYTAQRQLIGAHVRNACGYIWVSCLGDECERVVRRMAVSDGCVHPVEETQAPSESTAPCEFCKEGIRHFDFDDHMKLCPEAIVPCAQVQNGCQWTGARVSLDGHASSCPYESIKGFFALQSKRESSLSEENELLKHKVEVLEGTIRSMQREIQLIKTALGPWYRQEGVQYQPPSFVSGPDVFDPIGFHFMDIQHSPSINNTSNAPYHLHPSLSSISPLPTHSTSNTSSSSSLADYFPPEDHGLPTGTTSSRTSHNRSSSLSTIHFAENISTSSRSSVAPLNLSTTLEGCLTGLRESMVTLSAALESQGRRQELALTTEGLRSQEEVGSLKAIVHGLRMQVHSIMMDRNAQVTGRFPFNGNGVGGEASDENWTDGGGAQPGMNSNFPFPIEWFPPISSPQVPPRYNQYHPASSTTSSITKL